jgi:hypothetical protein
MTEAEQTRDAGETKQVKTGAWDASYAEGTSDEAQAKSDYLIISPHTPAECDAALNETEQLGSLSQFEWGCRQGDHTGYAIVRATSKEEALSVVPSSLREKARVVKVERFTAADLKAMHAGQGH